MKQSEVDDHQTNEENNDDDEVDGDDDDEADESGRNFITNGLVATRSTLWAFWCDHKSTIIMIILLIITGLYFAYFCWSLYYAFGDEGSIRLLWVTCLVVICLALSLLFRCLRLKFESTSASRPINFMHQNYILLNWFVAVFKHANIITCYARYDVCF